MDQLFLSQMYIFLNIINLNFREAPSRSPDATDFAAFCSAVLASSGRR